MSELSIGKGPGDKLKKHIIKYLKENGNMDFIDEITIDILCFNIDVWYKNKKFIEEYGAVQIFKNKTSNVNGFFTAMKQSFEHWNKLSRELGILEILKNKLNGMGSIPDDDKDIFK